MINIKKYIFTLLLFIPLIAAAQLQTQNQGNANTLITNRGGFGADSILRIPIRDTINWNDQWGNLTIRPQDNKLYFRAGGFWRAVASNTPGSGGAITWADTINLVATKKNLKDTAAALRVSINQREKLSNKINSFVGYTTTDTTYPTTRAVAEYIQNGVDPFLFYAYDRTIDSIDVYGNSTKYIKLYRHDLPAFVDSFQDNNTTYSNGFGIILTGTQFRADTSVLATINDLDSIIAIGSYAGIAPIVVNPTTHQISHANSGVTPSTYTKVTVNATGHITSGAALSQGDVPDISQNQVLGLVDTLNGINVNSITFTGTSVKTARITRGNSSWIQGSFTDNDNQTLSLSNIDSLSISGGNSIHLPYIRSLPGGTYQSFTGTATNSLTLTDIPAPSSGVFVTMNNAWLDPADWSISGNTVTLSFTTSTTDLITIYYSF